MNYESPSDDLSESVCPVEIGVKRRVKTAHRIRIACGIYTSLWPLMF